MIKYFKIELNSHVYLTIYLNSQTKSPYHKIYQLHTFIKFIRLMEAQIDGANSNQESNFVKTNNSSYPINRLGPESTNADNKSCSIRPDSSQALPLPHYNSLPIQPIISQDGRPIPPPPGLPQLIFLQRDRMTQQNDNIIRLNRLKIAGMVSMMAVLNIIYGASSIGPTCSDPKNSQQSCNSSIVTLVIYDLFGLVYLGVNILINVLNPQLLQGYFICLLTFRINSKEYCWHFGIGLLFGLLCFIMCLISLIFLTLYLIDYCKSTRENDGGNEGENGREQAQDVLPQVSNNQLVRSQ